jgi:hypothetical protein
MDQTLIYSYICLCSLLLSTARIFSLGCFRVVKKVWIGGISVVNNTPLNPEKRLSKTFTLSITLLRIRAKSTVQIKACLLRHYTSQSLSSHHSLSVRDKK